MTRLDQAVAHVAGTLDRLGIPYMVIGGFAVTVWGEPRLTQDVDVTIACDPGDAATVARLAEALAQPDVLEFYSSLWRTP